MTVAAKLQQLDLGSVCQERNKTGEGERAGQRPLRTMEIRNRTVPQTLLKLAFARKPSPALRLVRFECWPGGTVGTQRLPPLLGPSSPGPTAGSRNLAEGRQVDFPKVKRHKSRGLEKMFGS